MSDQRKLLTKSKVLVVEETSEWRYNIHNGIRNLGYRMVEGVASIRDALDRMENEPFGWIFLTLNPADNPNLFHILEMVNHYPELRHLKVSAFVKDQDILYLKQAFEMGLLSYHNFGFSKDELAKNLTPLNRRLSQHKWDTMFTSAEYIRDYLTSMEDYQSLVSFERRLIKVNPNHPELLIHLAEAFALQESFDDCARALNQAKLIDPSLEAIADPVYEKYLRGRSLGDSSETINLFNINTAMIVDSDEVNHNSLDRIFHKIGCERIIHCYDGEEALDKIIGFTPDIIVSEWKLPKLNGPFFVQRIRDKGLHNTPILIVSSLVNDSDRNLMLEMGISNVIPKPMIETDFLKALSWVIQQEQKPTDSSVIEYKVAVLCHNRKFNDARHVIQEASSNQNVKEGAIHYMRAELAYAQKDYRKAKNHLIKAVQQGNHTTRVYNLTGKTLIQLDDISTALKCYEKADSLAPYNIVRLCAIADAQDSIGESGLANQTLSMIKSLDPRNHQVMITEANFSLTRGAIKKAKRIMASMENLSEVFTFMNNRGVALAKRGKVNESIEFYEKAILALPEERTDITEAIQYNLALAHVRQKKYKDAQKILRSLKNATQKRIAVKAKRMLERIEDALKKGQEISLDSTKDDSEEKSVDMQDHVEERLSSFKILPPDPGDVCCHLIFFDSSPEVGKRFTITGLPRFRTYGSISNQKTA
ncbi:response regulator [Pseudobacteriovorax antillogorgiicola]|uniref:CheY chemotaxis protein or a CheY-like REC (Receiver) domain n=1 Tax=Pseudobacteriovorax antillogorgiicola TaxID=1513793 RepID=A0A1Y6C885_9BACT|nr:response regulator [Pseudobacteriovorax antillogorgiicola]TCS49373.1 CheY-like chemotaxis protein [Pseudobacteriovorax antillogorgiicola]SMF47404.1 CheY chemotaxis protein or a CheY-like REC (receiver) domain [Pseudobacteriovorax antillogorgiicola]